MNWTFEYSKEILVKEFKLLIECEVSADNEGYCTFSIKNKNLHKSLQILKEQYQFLKLVDVIVYSSTVKLPDSDFVLVFILERPVDSQIIFLQTIIENREQIADFSNLWQVGDWYLREIFEFFGISNTSGRNKQLFTHDHIKSFLLRKDDASEVVKEPTYRSFFKISSVLVPTVNSSKQWFSFGPFHPSTNNQFRILMELKEDCIGASEIEIGYHHIGLEKKFEATNSLNILQLLHRYKCLSGNSLPILWCKTVEEILQIPVSDRIAAIRMLYLEMDRIFDHLQTIQRMLELAVNDVAFALIKEIMHMFGEYMSQLGLSYDGRNPHRFGGFNQDIKRETVVFILQSIGKFERLVRQLEKQLTKSIQWIDQLSTNAITAKDAMKLGLEGPNLRACGVKFDLRKNDSYYLYDEVEFDIPLGAYGNSYDRYYVRMKEIYESVKIISQILDNVPSGKYYVPIEKCELVEKDKLNDSELNLKNYDEYYSHGPLLSSKEHFSRIENARGCAGIFIKSVGDYLPYRFKIIGPSYKLLSAIPEIIRNENIKRLPLLVRSLDINIHEVDR